MSEGALRSALRHAIDSKVACSRKSDCPLEKAFGERLQQLLAPPRVEREVVAVGVRDIAKLKHMKAAGCQKCSAYKSIRACGRCLRHRHECDPREEPSDHGASAPHEVSQGGDMPVPSLVNGIRPPVDPKPEKMRPQPVSRLSRQ
eukprot:TRINITY_DN17635_c1_g3_i2.p1 TRINITY_DN17635_c1_g3~~TRINITY_DN17635_c1_g3_i2.p1  ORF type:complete len:145 (+),score=9.59 TRINITY_DN17635_c1_g3_i2:82-516(+)